MYLNSLARRRFSNFSNDARSIVGSQSAWTYLNNTKHTTEMMLVLSSQDIHIIKKLPKIEMKHLNWVTIEALVQVLAGHFYSDIKTLF